MANNTAKEAMSNLKYETANELGVNLKQGYNGDLTSREAGSVGGQMVKKISPVRTLSFKRNLRNVNEHSFEAKYEFVLSV